jgi:hypothetical protein
MLKSGRLDECTDASLDAASKGHTNAFMFQPRCDRVHSNYAVVKIFSSKHSPIFLLLAPPYNVYRVAHTGEERGTAAQAPCL